MHVEGNYSHDWLANQPADHWRSAAAETRAGGMTGMGIHLLDAYSFLVGPMKRVSALATRRKLPLESGDTTSVLIEFRDGATATVATSLKTPYVWRLAAYGSDVWAESTSETGLTIQRSGGKPETLDLAPSNHIGQNLESFAAAALGQGRFHIDDDGNPAHGRRAGSGVPLGGAGRRVAGRSLGPSHLIACGLIGEPVPPVITSGAPQKKNS